MKLSFHFLFLLIFLLGMLDLSAQVNSRSGFPSPQESTSWLRTFPCGGEVIFQEKFNADTIPAGWQLLKLDTGSVHPNIAPDFKAGWQSIEDFKDASNRAIASPSWYSNDTVPADNWLITPAIKLSKNTCLSWYAYSQDVFFGESYEVRISTTGPTPDSAGFLAHPPLTEVSAEGSELNYRSVSVADYDTQTVYIAFRQTSLNKFILVLDDVRLAMAESSDIGVFQTEDFDITLGDSVMIRGAIRNYGLDSVELSDDVMIGLSILGDSIGAKPLFADTITVKIAPNDTLQFSFPDYWKPETDSVYYLCLFTIWDKDEDARNDSSCIRVGVGIDITGIGDQIEALPISLFPNPAGDFVQLEWQNQPNHMYLQLFDLQGSLLLPVQGLPVGSSKFELDLQDLPSGIYLLQIEDDRGRTFREKLIKR